MGFGHEDEPLAAIRYRPALTVVNITGTATNTGKEIETTSKIALGTVGDPEREVRLVIQKKKLEDQDFELKLTPDERLGASSVNTTGVGAEIVEAAVRIGALAAGTVAKAVMGIRAAEEGPAKEQGKPPPKPTPDTFPGEERRQALTGAIARLQLELTKIPDAIDTSTDVAALDKRVDVLGKALQTARNEKASLEAEFAKWKAERAISYAWAIPVDKLPRVHAAEDTYDLGEFNSLGNDDAALEAMRRLRIIVTRVDPRPDDHEHRPEEQEQPAIQFRYPRHTTLAVYKHTGDSKSNEYRLERVFPALVVDKWSDWGSIPIESEVFGKHGATAEFGDAGTLVHITNKQVSAVGQVAKVVSAAGGQVKDALDQAAAIRSAFPAAPDAAGQALQAEVAQKELEARLAVAERTIAGSTNGTS